jgi:PRC-barrel domain
MPFETGATVRTSDGQDAGTIESLVRDSGTNVVSGFVISTGGLLGRKVLIKPGELEDRTADGDAIRMRVSQTELEERPDYQEEQAAKP